MEDADRASRPSRQWVGADTTFHPCVVLLLDEEAERIATHLADLLASVPPAVRAWVELVPAACAADPTREKDFPSALETALARVTNVHGRTAVRRAGYRVGEASPLVLLVGHTSASALLPAARAAQHVTALRFPRVLRLALLSDSRPSDQPGRAAFDERARAQPWERLLGWVGSGAARVDNPEPPIALCCLYQDFDERSWHWNADPPGSPSDLPHGRVDAGADVGGDLAADSAAPIPPIATAPTLTPARAPEDVRYAVAEAIFALIASGLVDDPQFREHLRLTMPTVPGGGGEAAHRFGTLATARLAFPRMQVEGACARYEGAQLLSTWLIEAEREEQALGSRVEAATVGSISPAQRFVRALHGAIEDADDYWRGGQPSPPLSAVGVSRLYGFMHVQVDPARLFAAFQPSAVAREVEGTSVGVSEALEALDARARLRYGRWREAIGEVWSAEFARRQHAIAEQVEGDLLDGPAGLGRARAYLRELRQGLTLAHERQEDAERFRAAAFARYVRALAAEVAKLAGTSPKPACVSPGVTCLPAVPSNQLDATASAGLPTPLDTPTTLADALQAADPTTPYVAASPTAPDDSLAALSCGSLPALAGSVPASLPAIPLSAPDDASTAMPEALQRLADLLRQQLERRDSLLLAHATIAAICTRLPLLRHVATALASALPRRPPRARRLLVGLYVHWWAQVCARAEDAQRRAGLATLMAAVEERLAAITRFESQLHAAAIQLRAGADRLAQALETDPAARRDVFVLAGHRFSAWHLTHLHEAVRSRRALDPVDPRHASDAAVGAAFRASLQAGDVPLVERTSATLAEQAKAFGAAVCHPYLSGDLVTVIPSIRLRWEDGDSDEQVSLGTLLERATPLYRPHPTDNPRRLVALAAPAEVDLAEGAARPHAPLGLARVVTPSVEWLLVAQLVSQARPRWWRRPLAEQPNVNTFQSHMPSLPSPVRELRTST